MNNSAKSGSLLARDVVINECAIECEAAKGKVDEVECRRELLSFTEGHLKHEHKFTKRQTFEFCCCLPFGFPGVLLFSCPKQVTEVESRR